MLAIIIFINITIVLASLGLELFVCILEMIILFFAELLYEAVLTGHSFIGLNTYWHLQAGALFWVLVTKQ